MFTETCVHSTLYIIHTWHAVIAATNG